MASFIVYGDASGQVTVKAPAVAGSNTITFPAETGTLVTTASTSMPNTIQWNTTVQTTGFTAVANAGYFCNTTSAAFTVTLPATPTRGQFVVIVDYAGTSATNNITVSGNGSKINGSGTKLLQTNRQGITFTYIDSTQGWLATSNVYGGNPPFITAPYTASYLVVAGGGSGGCYAYGGGGGAGGYLSGTITINSGTVYTATVGAGGAGAATRYVANSGSNSVLSGSGITTQTAIGGGYGAQLASGNASGGSGGGGTYVNAGTSPGAAGTPGQGNAGGTTIGRSAGSGGGGASAAGSNASGSTGSAGGDGTASSITGTPATYAGGGGGGAIDPSGGSGPGGAGGGGAGGSGSSVNGIDGTANTGGGGGGSSFTPAFIAASGSGGSGVVILSVPTSSYSGTTTGSPTITTSGSNTIIKWTSGSGTYTG